MKCKTALVLNWAPRHEGASLSRGMDPYILNYHTMAAGQPLWSSRQSSWLQIQRSMFDSRRYQIFWEVVGLERDPLSLVSTTEELLGRKSSSSSLETREYDSRDPSRWPSATFYPRKFALTSPTSGGRWLTWKCGSLDVSQLPRPLKGID
jgi:hypothetical protein